MRPRLLVLSLAVLVAAVMASAEIPSPEEHFGFRPGADRELFDYSELLGYLDALDAASPRLEVRRVGTSPQGRPMVVAFLSAPANLEELDRLRDVNRRLAMEPELTQDEINRLVEQGRVFVMATLSMHSTEVGPTQAFPLLAHDLATTEDLEVLAWLEKVVLMVVPCHNPDGMDMVVHHYREGVGTEYEGASMPGVYHRYVGHDNNRDFVTLTQEDTRVISRLYSTEWFPQVLVEKHQMGSSGPRYFVPANHDPIAENVDEGLWTWTSLFGSELQHDMTAAGQQGVASQWLFDNYWPGSTDSSLWKNVISFLTEAASCRVATPVYVEPTELTVRGKGLSEYKKSTNMPDPWPGGWWRLGDIVDYELVSLRSILATAAEHHAEILRFRNRICRSEVAKGRSEAPAYYVLPAEQHDSGALPRLASLLAEHGVQLRSLGQDTVVDGTVLPAGSLVVPLAQPYRAFVKEVMEDQRYPVRHYTPGGTVIRPYDITSWSLPLHWGLRRLTVPSPSAELESRLGPWAPSKRAVALGDGLWGVAWPSSHLAGFQAAFAALGRGAVVSRIRSAVAVDGRQLPAGSFVMRIEENGRDVVEEVMRAAGQPPVVLMQPPEAQSVTLSRPRIALVETFVHDMDAGWTRYLFDQLGIPFTVIRPGEVADVELAARYDVVVFPDVDEDVLREGKLKRGDEYVVLDYPPELREGLGSEGMLQLSEFVRGGGVVVAWGRSARLFSGELPVRRDEQDDSLRLPVRDVSPELGDEGAYVPGAFLRVRVDVEHPLGWGLRADMGVFSRGRPVFATSLPRLDTDRRVVVSHPDEEDLLLSGYLEEEKLLHRKAVGVWVRVGQGQLALYGFQPQFRASTPATYPFLLNALLLGSLDADDVVMGTVPLPGGGGR